MKIVKTFRNYILFVGAKEQTEKFLQEFLYHYNNSNFDRLKTLQYDAREWITEEDVAFKRNYSTFPILSDWLSRGGYREIGHSDPTVPLYKKDEFDIVNERNPGIRYFQILVKEMLIADSRESKTIEQVTEEFFEGLEKDYLEFSIVTVIQGLNFQKSSVQITDNSKIEKISDKEREVLFNGNDTYEDKELEKHLKTTHEVYALKTKVRVDVEELDEYQDPQKLVFRSGYREVKKNFRDALRISGVGDFSVSVTDILYENFWNHRAVRITEENPSYQGLLSNQENVSEDKIEEIQKIFGILEKIDTKNDEALRIGLERFKSSYFKDQNSDSLLECFIGLEAILKYNGDEDHWKPDVAERVIDAVSDDLDLPRNQLRTLLVGIDIEDSRYEETELVDSLYGKRSKVAHGDQVNVPEKSLDRIRGILRLVLKKFLVNGDPESNTAHEWAATL